MPLRQISNEVYVSSDPIVKVSRADVAFLKGKLAETSRGRVRLCAHRDGSDLLHEMIIVLAKSTYVRPHKHFNKSESFHIIEGSVDVVLFDDVGRMTDVIELGDLSSGKQFYYRLAAPIFHTLIIHSDPLVIHETTNGPFQKGDALFASWAPDESDTSAASDFMRRLSDSLAKVT